jgi:hypothetical protein
MMPWTLGWSMGEMGAWVVEKVVKKKSDAFHKACH